MKNKQPMDYKQGDSRWGSLPYQVDGKETATIRGSGCGPVSAAMLITTLACTDYTPDKACAWAKAHGYKAPNQGTYYGYFPAIFKQYGIACKRLNGSNAYHKPDHPAHRQALDLLKSGWYLIACMGKGRWTRSGHFVVVWWADGVIHINDPASNRKERLNGNPAVFTNEVKYYWGIDGRAYNRPTPPKKFPAKAKCAVSTLSVRSGPSTKHKRVGYIHRGATVDVLEHRGGWYRIASGWISMEYMILEPVAPEEEDDDMKFTYEEWKAFQKRYEAEQAKEKATMPDLLNEAGEMGITDKTRPMSNASRQEVAVMCRKTQKNGEEFSTAAVQELYTEVKEVMIPEARTALLEDLKKIIQQNGSDVDYNPDDYPSIDMPEEV